jgi:hypothetical protein
MPHEQSRTNRLHLTVLGKQETAPSQKEYAKTRTLQLRDPLENKIDQRMKGGDNANVPSNSPYILILRFQSFFSFDAMAVSWGTDGVGAFQAGGT